MPRMRAISPLVATAILLAATIAVGYLIYNYVSASTGAIANKPQLLITANADYVGSTAYVEIDIKNVGAAAAKITQIKIDNVYVTSSWGTSTQAQTLNIMLQPGEELHKVITISNLNNGKHVILVTVEDQNGNTYQFKSTFVS